MVRSGEHTTSPLKVMVVAPYYYPRIGGLEVYARQLGLALHELKNWELFVVTSNHEAKQTTIEVVDGMRVYRLKPWLKFSNTPLNPLWPFVMKRIIKKERPDLIIAHTPVPSLADAAALAAGKTPLIVIYHASTLLKNGSGSFIFNMVARMYKLYEQLLLNRANRIVAVSDFVKQQFPRRLQHKIVVVPNSVWKNELKNRRQPRGANFLFIGALHRTHAWKGLDQIIEAIAIYRKQYGKQCTLTVMGDGDARARYEEQAAHLGLAGHVMFLGNKTGAEKEAAFTTPTALIVYPTTANDAFPTVILEAWARSVPVIAAAIGPLPSLVKHRTDGYLVEPHNPHALAQLLDEVAHSTAEQREKLAITAQRRTSERYTWERQADAIEHLAQELVV